MFPKLYTKIILEGTRLTFKTEIAFALNEHRRIIGLRHYRYFSPITPTEWCAFTNYPRNRDLINNLICPCPSAENYDNWQPIRFCHKWNWMSRITISSAPTTASPINFQIMMTGTQMMK